MKCLTDKQWADWANGINEEMAHEFEIHTTVCDTCYKKWQILLALPDLIQSDTSPTHCLNNIRQIAPDCYA